MSAQCEQDLELAQHPDPPRDHAEADAGEGEASGEQPQGEQGEQEGGEEDQRQGEGQQGETTGQPEVEAGEPFVAPAPAVRVATVVRKPTAVADEKPTKKTRDSLFKYPGLREYEDQWIHPTFGDRASQCVGRIYATKYFVGHLSDVVFCVQLIILNSWATIPYICLSVLGILITIFEIRRGAQVVKKGDLGEAFMNDEARRYYTLRSIKHSVLFSQIKSRLSGRTKWIAWMYFSLQVWYRYFCVGIPQVIISVAFLTEQSSADMGPRVIRMAPAALRMCLYAYGVFRFSFSCCCYPCVRIGIYCHHDQRKRTRNSWQKAGLRRHVVEMVGISMENMTGYSFRSAGSAQPGYLQTTHQRFGTNTSFAHSNPHLTHSSTANPIRVAQVVVTPISSPQTVTRTTMPNRAPLPQSPVKTAVPYQAPSPQATVQTAVPYQAPAPQATNASPAPATTSDRVIYCPTCLDSLNAGNAVVGSHVECPHCKNLLTVPPVTLVLD